jgi:hypothetical protein
VVAAAHSQVLPASAGSQPQPQLAVSALQLQTLLALLLPQRPWAMKHLWMAASSVCLLASGMLLGLILHNISRPSGRTTQCSATMQVL